MTSQKNPQTLCPNMATLCSPLLALGLLAAAGSLADDKPALEQVEAQQANEMAARIFADMKCRLADGRALKSVEKSVLRWSNPDVGRVYGEVHLWTLDGRPEAVVSLYQWFSPIQIKQAEFRSLSRERLAVGARGQDVWTPNEPGLDWRPLEPAPAPAATPTQRLTQMRTLARRFGVVLKDPRPATLGVARTLRLLTQPLYRYDAPAAPVLDGALFSFVHGTDPELFVLLEARAEKEESAWYYALARMNNGAMDVDLDGQVIWQVQRSDDLSDKRGLYHLATVSDRP